jgi:vesicle transport through interaction with t-SNAREs protein 1
MEVELPSMPVSIRQTYQQRLTTSRAGLEKVKKTLVRHILLPFHSPYSAYYSCSHSIDTDVWN